MPDVTIASVSKTCSVCGLEKTLENFSPQKAGRMGVTARCKSCAVKASRTYRLSSHGAWLASQMRWRQKNSSRWSELKRESWERHREENLAKAHLRYVLHPEMATEANYRRRLRFKAGFVEKVCRRTLHGRYNGLCGLCLKSVSLEEMTVDHIIPLAAGGEHSYANTQPAHSFCNKSKGAKILVVN